MDGYVLDVAGEGGSVTCDVYGSCDDQIGQLEGSRAYWIGGPVAGTIRNPGRAAARIDGVLPISDTGRKG